MGFQAVTTDDSELLWVYRLVRTKHHLKDAGGHKHSPIGFGYLCIPASTPIGFIMVGCCTHPACLLRPSLSLGSVGTTTSVASLASGFWAPTRLKLHFSTRRVPTLTTLSAPIFLEGYFTVTLSSGLPLLSTPTRCLSQCSAPIALQQAIPMHRYSIGIPNLPIATEVDDCPI
jgi:hypothetical protein